MNIDLSIYLSIHLSTHLISSASLSKPKLIHPKRDNLEITWQNSIMHFVGSYLNGLLNITHGIFLLGDALILQLVFMGLSFHMYTYFKLNVVNVVK